ncbi:MAG: hypothetical protein K9K67_12400 [Bacteriovoracaceae bacterium]|nr:hypothetical protein [Bacteriovoracaceae bacterium]
MKKLFLLTTFLFACTLLYIFIIRGPEGTQEGQWQTYKKTGPQNIYSYPTTPEEKKEAKIVDGPKKEEKPLRSPASKKVEKMKERTSIKGRNWSLLPGQDLPKTITYLNKVNDNWKGLMGQDILRFLRPKTSLFIKPQARLTLLERDGGRHVEQVMVKMLSPEGRHFSYQAYIDSETGKIIKTWNNTIHEPMGKKTTTFRATGSIGPSGSTRF